MKFLFFAVVSGIILFSCNTSKKALAFEAIPEKSPDQGEPITQSLFTDKTATISEENIQKILDGNYKLPQQLRVAIVKLDNTSSNGRYYSSYWSDEQYLKTQQAYIDMLTGKIKRSPRVTSVSAIPGLLIAKPQTFTTIREAAVRLQADIVIVYSITTDLYSKYKLFTKADIKAFATTQLIILDVRTGLIPFSAISTKDQLSKKQPEDLDNNEASNRIQKEAVLMTIDEIGEKLSDFLNK